jgi:hypothetical protein
MTEPVDLTARIAEAKRLQAEAQARLDAAARQFRHHADQALGVVQADQLRKLAATVPDFELNTVSFLADPRFAYSARNLPPFPRPSRRRRFRAWRRAWVSHARLVVASWILGYDPSDR